MGSETTTDSRLFADGTLRVDLVVAALAAVALAGTAWLIRDELDRGGAHAADAVAVGVAKTIVGSAKRRPGASLVWARLDLGESLVRGDGVFVADNSSVDLLFRDGSHLSVSENSLVVVDLPESGAAQPRVDVRRGAVAGRAGTGGLLFQIRGSSVALASGGEARVSGGGDAEARVSVEKGTASVESAGGATQVGAKQTAVVSDAGVGPTRDLTVELVEPAAGATVFVTGNRGSVPFAWRGGSGELEIADDATFTKITRRQAAADGATVDLPAGGYFWRVRDDHGQALSMVRALNVVQDKPPSPLQPAARSVIYLANQETVAFVWSRVPGVGTYRVEIAAAVAFGELAFSAQVDAPQLRFGERLPEGDYFWRVRSMAPERGESPWSEPVKFKLAVEPLPRAPELYDSEVEVIERGAKKKRKKKKRRQPPPEEKPDEGASLLWRLFVGGVAHAGAPSAAIVLRWEAVPGIQRYVLQIAEDKAFTRVVVREDLTANWYRWHKISKREYWWRVKSIDAKGREGVFSQPRSVGAVLSAPRLLAPRPAETVRIAARVPTVQFSWDHQRLAARYEWSIASDAGFSRGVVTRTSATTKLQWKPTSAGAFFWRVRAADASGAFTRYSKTLRLEVTLEAPVAAAVADVIMADPPPKIELTVRPLATVSSYDVQVASERSFAEPMVSAKTKAPRWVFEPRVAGVVWWRWRATSGGRKSAWGAPVALTLRLVEPVVSAPASGARLGFRTPESATAVVWAPVPGAVGYQVVVSAGERELSRLEVAAPPAAIPALAAGRYSVRVRAVAGGIVAESAPIPFERVALPALAAPSAVDPEAGAWLATSEPDTAVSFRWVPVDDASGYQLEVAEAVAGEWVRTPEAGVAIARAGVARGAYNWRVRAVDGDGVPGPYSETLSFRVGPPPPTTAVIDVAPEPVMPGAADARIDIVLRDDRGRPVPGANAEATAVRGSVHDLRDQGDGRYVGRYVPPPEFEVGEDTVVVTVPGLASFRVEEAVRLGDAGGSFLVGGSVGLVSNFEVVLSPTVHAEIGYRLPWWHGRVIASLRGGYHYASDEREEEPRVTVNQYSVPLALGLMLEFPYSSVVPYGTAHLLVGVMVGRFKAVGQDEYIRTEIGLGAEVGLGAAYALGPGALFGEVRFGWVRGSDEKKVFELDAGGLVPVIGYRLEI